MNDMEKEPTTSTGTPLKVTVLCGGTSAEREISLASGANVIHALEDAGYQVDILDPQDPAWITRLAKNLPDVVFPMLHGRGGEDGSVQALCELLGVPYVGSGILASATALDKVRTKQVCAATGLLTPACCAIRPHHPYNTEEIIGNLGSCLVVKPAVEGSSLGMSIIHQATPEKLQEAIDKAFAHDETVLIEQYISGTEVTVPVLGNRHPKALPSIEIVPAEGHDFYDFEAKYKPNQSTHIIPSRLGESVNEQLSRIAERIHELLDCKGFSRTDFIVTIDENSELLIFLIEINTIPGMTDTSLVPESAKAAGIEMPQLVTMLVDLALEKD
jgi:D-alanine-D-alanine ligase